MMRKRKTNNRRKFLRTTGLGLAGLTVASSMPTATSAPCIKSGKRNSQMELWYREPAKEWMEALPVGNGRLGAMIFGRTEIERIALNEITLWAGKPDPDQELACGKEKLAEIRQFFFAGNLQEGNEQAIRFLSGKPNSFGTHIPFGDLLIDFGHSFKEVTDYRRSLDLENAIATLEYTYRGVRYSRTCFCSNPDQVLVIVIKASKLKQLNTTLKLDSLSPLNYSVTHDQILFKGKAHSTLKVPAFPRFSEDGVQFAGGLHLQIKDGTTKPGEKSLQIKDATEIRLFFDLQTNYKLANPAAVVNATLHSATRKKIAVLQKLHVTDYNRLFGRVHFNLKGPLSDAMLPTDERLRSLKEGQPDISIYPLFFQFNRYLLISCSRENSPLPANLQGLWNDNLAANMPWTCDYHLDINTQQNYWASNITNLAECQVPLYDFIRYLQTYGRKTAQKVYGSKGWVAHTVCNVWGYTAPGEWPGWGLFPTAGTWIALHLWEQFQFTQDITFLKETAYPVLKDNAVFFLDYMMEDPETGYLLTGPTTSPENSFRYKGHTFSLSMMPTCDRVLVMELFEVVRQAAILLLQDQELVKLLETAIAKLPPLQIGKNGALQEWLDDYEEAIPNHRHTTHLLALYPYAQVDSYRDPALAQACRNTMEKRMSAPNWEDVEWSRGNMINFYARLKDGEAACNSLYLMLKQFTSNALLTYSVAGIAGADTNIFILDGNQSACSGTAEMLVQSHNGVIEYLPAIPASWHSGEFKGLCIRGGGEVAAKWEAGLLQSASLTSHINQDYKIRWKKQRPVKFRLNSRVIPPAKIINDILEISLVSGDLLEFYFVP